ncbi:sugar phosphate isomerase/epimerase family protein [Paenibacillus sp. NPDC056579]|uniref:sugar phosphate isomerase/epimerase family protein n=1 Tax=Paenibacillus sp. NPDC056579 TaxID=3345871 RepID=UPI0036CC4CEE
MNTMLYTLFPKFFQSLDVHRLAEVAQASGFDAVDLVVRDGYWVTPERFAVEAPAFVQAMQRNHMKVEFATTGFSPEMLAQDDTPLKVMSDIGIRGFRMSYFSYDEREPLFAQMEQARASMQQMAELCAKYNLKAVYQVHHGERMLIHHAYAALTLVDGLPAEHVGIMLDPGNQFHEGTDNWKRAIATLGAYLAGMGMKDARYVFNSEDKAAPNKGWSKQWTPCQDGVTNWHVIAKALHEAKFQGVLNFQPFYHSNNLDLLIPALQEEVAYIKKAMQETGEGTA